MMREVLHTIVTCEFGYLAVGKDHDPVPLFRYGSFVGEVG